MNIEKGEPNGVLTSWQESGAKARELHIAHGVRHGIDTEWDESGQVIGKRCWRDDELTADDQGHIFE